MKVLLGADQYPEYINGAAQFTGRLAAGLAEAGHTVDLLWPAADGAHQTYLDQGVRVHRLSSVKLPGRPRMQASLPWTVRREVAQALQIARPDVVHVQSHLGLGRTLLREARAHGLPVLATNHFMPENLLHHVPLARRFPAAACRLAWRDLERVFAGADLLSVPTRRAADLLAAMTGLPPAEVISCGVDLARYRPAREPGRGTRRILFVGRLEQEKHVDELLAAFALVPRQLGAHLEIVGMGSRRSELEAQARRLGLGASVTFAGAVPDAELLAAYQRADLFVMPGTAELQSLATLEALASGLPVIAAAAMALPHLVHDGVNGWLYPPGATEELALRMTALLADAERRATFGQAGSRIAEQHSLGQTLAAFESCYRRLLPTELAAVPAGDDALAAVR